MTTGFFYGVGLGPGDPELVTLKALATLQRAQTIYTVISRQSERSVSGGILDALPGLTGRRVELEFTMVRDFPERLARIDRHAETIAAELHRGRDCAFATIGDPSTYSTCSYLLRALRRELPELRFALIPGVNSWSALAARLAVPLAENGEELRIIPAQAGPDPELPETGTAVLLKSYHDRDRLLAQLPPELELAYGANLGLPGEFASCDRAEIAAHPVEYLSLLAVRRPEPRD